MIICYEIFSLPCACKEFFSWCQEQTQGLVNRKTLLELFPQLSLHNFFFSAVFAVHFFFSEIA